jgi:hypothetical protein
VVPPGKHGIHCAGSWVDSRIRLDEWGNSHIQRGTKPGQYSPKLQWSKLLLNCKVRNIRNHLFWSYQGSKDRPIPSAFLGLCHTRCCSHPSTAGWTFGSITTYFSTLRNGTHCWLLWAVTQSLQQLRSRSYVQQQHDINLSTPNLVVVAWNFGTFQAAMYVIGFLRACWLLNSPLLAIEWSCQAQNVV